DDKAFVICAGAPIRTCIDARRDPEQRGSTEQQGAWPVELKDQPEKRAGECEDCTIVREQRGQQGWDRRDGKKHLSETSNLRKDARRQHGKRCCQRRGQQLTSQRHRTAPGKPGRPICNNSDGCSGTSPSSIAHTASANAAISRERATGATSFGGAWPALN